MLMIQPIGSPILHFLFLNNLLQSEMLIRTCMAFSSIEHKRRCLAEFAKHYFWHSVQAMGLKLFVYGTDWLKFESLLAENLALICISFIFRFVTSRCIFSLMQKSSRTFCIASFVFRV